MTNSKGNPNWKNGHSKIGGRKKGSKNKMPLTVKENFEAVFKKLGGVDGFSKWADKNTHTQSAFYQMYSKMLPSNTDLDVKGDLSLIIKRIISDERPEE